MTALVRRLPEPLAVVAAIADDDVYARARARLDAITGTTVATLRVSDRGSALAALDERPHDVVLVHADVGLTRDILERSPYAAVILLTDARDQAAELAAADAGVAETLPLADLDALERAVRAAVAYQRTLKRLAESEERHALALQGANDGLWDWDVSAERMYFSPRWKAMLGYGDRDLGEQPGEWLGRVHPDDRPALSEALNAHLSGTTEHFELEHRVQASDGSYRWMLARAIAVRDPHGRALRVVGSQTDVTDRKEAERRLQHDALHDALTGLPNRVLFLDRVDQAIRRARRNAPECCAGVLFLDLDRFKLVNDSLGHHAGDRLLVAVASRLQSVLRPNDTVARLGGDEFTLLLEDVVDPREATLVAERVQQTLAAPFLIDGRELFVAASIGIAIATADASPEEVMRDADAAMYRAKAEGRARLAVFDSRMHEQVRRRLDMEDEFRRALERQELALAFQPIVQAATGRLVGFEALCRWPDGREHVEPQEFIAIAEETGLIRQLGRWVLMSACCEAAQWRRLPHGGGLSVSVNLTGRELAEPGFVPSLGEILHQSELDPRALRLELREFDLSVDPGIANRVLRELLDTHGVRAHLDDFGTGPGSLRLVQAFPGEAIKICRGLVMGMGREPGSFEIVKAIVGLAHNLGFEVIAAGVETAEQLDYLKVLGCEFAQGFNIGVPLDAAAARRLVERGVPVR